ncbi:hypothetical protein NDA01_03295 [Trichocoleus desertorum AS-A10]|uniref:hypothetical protein n=1 Tax=Trichocoleus desertorum TaxID=1481672 RepID=UPI00329923B2
MVDSKLDVQTDAWQRLAGKISPLILQAPKTGGDPQGKWTKVHDKLVCYLERNALGKPWADHLALITAVMMAHHLQVNTILSVLRSLNSRWGKLFPALELQTLADWDGKKHMRMYLEVEVLPEDSQVTRVGFWSNYVTAVNHTHRWLKSLPEPIRENYRPFILPYIDSREVEGLISDKEIQERQRQKRKSETDALMPHFLQVRAQGHLRYNKMSRLLSCWFQALQTIVEQNLPFPFSFFCEEGQERLHFKVWDRRSFVIAHASDYCESTVKKARQGVGAFVDERNRPFLEFVKAERLSDDAPPEGFWFEDMLRVGVIGQAGQRLFNQELAEKRQSWLRNWGYGEEDSDKRSAPFKVSVSEVLNWSHKDAVFIAQAQIKAKGVFIPVEAFYVAAVFGLLAVELFTTTGMRINELLQVRLSKDAFTRVEIPPTAAGQPPSFRHVFHLIPKGERTDKPHDYFIAQETTRLLVKVAKMLQEHYAINLDNDESLPAVPFNPGHSRSHRFGDAPYLFQYNHRHLNDRDITACMRFLLHGMVFKTREGKPVVLKAHLLRHGFANHAVQVGKVAIDVVGSWLHQKNPDITWYYAQATGTQISEASDLFLARLASHFDLGEFIIRSPEELRQQREDALKLIGTLNPVSGGDCTFNFPCIHGLACNGCGHKVPDPSKRYQVEGKIDWAKDGLASSTEQGLRPEAEQLKDLIRRCEVELLEMDQIEHYQEDENRDATICIE